MFKEFVKKERPQRHFIPSTQAIFSLLAGFQGKLCNLALHLRGIARREATFLSFHHNKLSTAKTNCLELESPFITLVMTFTPFTDENANSLL